MKLTLLAFFVITILMCLWGCIPYIGTYYEPSAGEGKVDGSGGFYAPTTLYLERGEGIYINIDGGMFWDNTTTNNRLSIFIIVPPNESLHLPIDKIRIVSKDSKDIATLSSGTSEQWFGSPPAKHAKLVGTETELNGNLYEGKYGTAYDLEFTFNIPKPDVFYVELPATQTGGASYPPLNVKITKTHGWWIQPIM